MCPVRVRGFFFYLFFFRCSGCCCCCCCYERSLGNDGRCTGPARPHRSPARDQRNTTSKLSVGIHDSCVKLALSTLFATASQVFLIIPDSYRSLRCCAAGRAVLKTPGRSMEYRSFYGLAMHGRKKSAVGILRSRGGVDDLLVGFPFSFYARVVCYTSSV